MTTFGQDTQSEATSESAAAAAAVPDSVELIDPGLPARIETDDDGEPCVTSRVRGGKSCAATCQCQTCCAAKCMVDPYNRLLPQGGWMRVRGWVDGGVFGNASNPGEPFQWSL